MSTALLLLSPLNFTLPTTFVCYGDLFSCCRVAIGPCSFHISLLPATVLDPVSSGARPVSSSFLTWQGDADKRKTVRRKKKKKKVKERKKGKRKEETEIPIRKTRKLAPIPKGSPRVLLLSKHYFDKPGIHDCPFYDRHWRSTSLTNLRCVLFLPPSPGFLSTAGKDCSQGRCEGIPIRTRRRV